MHNLEKFAFDGGRQGVRVISIDQLKAACAGNALGELLAGAQFVNKETGREGFFYVVDDEPLGLVKMGFSVNVKLRMHGLRHDAKTLAYGKRKKTKPRLLCSFPATEADEKRILKRFEEFREHGEWFRRCEQILTFADEMRASASSARKA